MNRRGFFRGLARAALGAAAMRYAPGVLVRPAPERVPVSELFESMRRDMADAMFYGTVDQVADGMNRIAGAHAPPPRWRRFDDDPEPLSSRVARVTQREESQR
jgi:hypothetical protein